MTATQQRPKLRSADQQRVPPHDLVSEMSLLGAMLLSRDAIADALEILTPDDFYKPAHSHIFEEIAALDSAGDPADIATVAERLTRAGLLQAVGGPAYLLELQGSTPATSNASRYARTVAELAQLRRIIGAAGEIAELGYSLPDDVEAAVDRAQQLVHDVAERSFTTEGPSWNQSITDFLDELERRMNGDGISGVPSGFIDLDEITTGFRPGQLILIGARPGMGKTSLALGIAMHAAKEGHHSLFFSLEMSRLELMERAMAGEARVDLARLRHGTVVEKDWPRLHEAMGRLADLPLHIEDDPTATVGRIRSVCRRYRRKHGRLDLVVVDYLGLMTPQQKGENRQNDVAEMSRGLKVLARELDVPVIALSQLSRNLEVRADKRPILSDLRDSGALEQDSDVVLFAYRDEVYKPDSADRGTAEVIVAKHRNGPTGVVRLAFLDRYTRFANMMRSN